jgi:hypothetical protein
VPPPPRGSPAALPGSARSFQDFSIQCTDRQFEFPQVCKSRWGTALLYRITGDPAYGAWSERLGDWFVETQAPDGAWRFDDDATLGQTVELTAEFVVHLDTIIGGLESRR